MNNRQWITRVLKRQAGQAVPYNFTLSPPARAKLERHYSTRNVEETLGMPIRMNAPITIKPLYASPAKFGPLAKDEFGVVWTTNDIDRGAPVGPCLKEPDLRGYTFPNTSAEYRFEALGAWSAANRDNFTIIWVGDLWERATFMRGMEELLLDLSLNEPFVSELLRRLADHVLGTVKILLERFEFDCIALSDDYGTQHGLIMSPECWRRLIRPLAAEIYALAHKHGRATFHHSCGNVRPIVGDLIEIGLDILHPIQPEAMDIFELKRTFGRDITFCGGLGTQELLPYASPERVRDEVRRLKDKMGADGGYILEPGITVQADVPEANLVAMIEEAKK